MAYGIAVEEAGEVDLYRFGRSKQIFRGPKPDLGGGYLTFIGGSATFGKFVREPYPKLIENRIGTTCVNLGTPGAGPGFFLKDPVVLETCSRSIKCIVQVMDIAPLSNRMYEVYPRRNMRLRGVSAVLRSLYPQLDFADFRFVSAMIRKLKEVDGEAYEVVLAEQRSAWLARMLELLLDIETAKTLLWIRPDEDDGMNQSVTQEMIDVLASHVDTVLTVSVGESNNLGRGLAGLRKDTGWMTRAVHTKIASVISDELQALQPQKRPA
ncbi:hypothetical protein A9Q96_15945 [Rhodobacterales bacterium 52_120_T64]|nr:hypothetical protein A9Q96_15945 [Rhodobacterales bacterium 52_120_T64]